MIDPLDDSRSVAGVRGTPQSWGAADPLSTRPGLRRTANPCHPIALGLIFSLFLLWARTSHARADDPGVSIADLPEYQAALAAKPEPSAVTPVTFRELWEHPQAHRGRPVEVEGRLARLFRQPSVGQFPPLAEGWITSSIGDPTCLVFPTSSGRVVPAPGDRVRFVGTFLRRITYRGSDTDRVAPLVVGSEPPSVLDPAFRPTGGGFGSIFRGDHLRDWGIGLALGLGVLWVLLRRHLTRPQNVVAPVGPAPTFRDGDDPEADDEFAEGADHVEG